MKKSVLLFLPLLIAGYLMLSGYGGGPDTDYPGGSPAGYTGSPGDGQNCKNCHGGSATTVPGMITSNIPAAGYTPGATYTITVTVTGSNSKGFEVSPQNASGALLGTLTAGSGNKLVGSGKYVTQSSASNASTATWSFGWTAPAAGTGTVTFYGAFTASKPVTKLSTLVVNENAPFTATAFSSPGTICAGQTSQLNVSVSGGSGTYTYSWSSVPAGFSSGLQNPVVTPAENTSYTVVVSDGTGSTSSTTTVSVNQAATADAGIDTTYCTSILSFPNYGLATNFSSVLWSSSGDGTFANAGELNSTYTPGAGDKATGFVNLYLTANPIVPCSSPAQDGRHIVLDPCSGIPAGTANPTLAVYPNPASGQVWVEANGLNGEAVSVQLLDGHGSTVAKAQFSGEVSIRKSFELSGFPKGIYLVRLQNGQQVKSVKLLLD